MSWLAGITIDQTDNDNLGVDWVLQYEFGDLGMFCMHSHSPHLTYLTLTLPHTDQNEAIAEFRTLMTDLSGAGLRVQVRHGHGKSLLVCIRVPRDHLGKMVQKSRYTLTPGTHQHTLWTC